MNSTEFLNRSSEAITKELIPIREKIQILNDCIAQPNLKKEKDEQQHEEEVEQPEPNIFQLFYQKVPDKKLDKYFGIVPDGEHNYKMGKTCTN